MGRFATNATPLSGAGTPGTGATGTGLLPIGAPVSADTAAGLDSFGRQVIKLATAGADVPPLGMDGLLVYEFAPAAFAGTDPMLTTWSDLGLCPAGRGVQVVRGGHVKVVFYNTFAEVFLGQRTYPGRLMIPGIGATPTVAVGNYLVPGQGDDTDGYWTSTATLAGAWMVITGIDTVRQAVEARMLF
jgi:hypothetical protein